MPSPDLNRLLPLLVSGGIGAFLAALVAGQGRRTLAAAGGGIAAAVGWRLVDAMTPPAPPPVVAEYLPWTETPNIWGRRIGNATPFVAGLAVGLSMRLWGPDVSAHTPLLGF